MTLQLTLGIGGTYVIPFVEWWRRVSATDVEVKTYGNEPVINRNITHVEEIEHPTRSVGMSYCGEDIQ